MSLNSIINIQIDRQTTAVTKKGFGTAMVLVEDADWKVADNTRIQKFAESSEVLAFFGAGVVADWADAYFGQSFKPVALYTGHIEALESITDGLAAIEIVNSDWYAAAMISKAEADILELAGLIQARRKIFGASSLDADILLAPTTDIASLLKAAGYDRTFVIYSADADTEHPEAAWLGEILPQDAGSVTWKFKSLAGITVSSELTTTEKSNALSKNCNTYTPIGGVNITEEGNMSSGEFIDVIRGTDWLHARMQERIFSLLVNVAKVPYTQKGIDLVLNEVDAQLAEGVRKLVLADDPAPFSSAPALSEISTNDKALRSLPDLKFEAVLAGAIHSITIKGVVKV